nr:unnamed protein product [Callosobruchus analis]
MSTHPKTASKCELKMCILCNTKFKRNRAEGKFTNVKNANLKLYLSTAKRITDRKPRQGVYQKEGKVLFRCNYCNYATHSKHQLITHLEGHSNKNIVPISETGIENKLYECAECLYITTIRSKLDRHMSIHDDKITCSHCHAFRDRSTVDEHVLNKHPEFSNSITSKIYECTECAYKTTINSIFLNHMSIHTGYGSSSKRTCVHCNAVLSQRTPLDEHILKMHPELITLITKSIYQCTECNYKTTSKFGLKRHMSGHENKITCIHCNATFRERSTLDGHTLNKHPEFVASITSKIYECTECTYKTTVKRSFLSHMSVHRGSSSRNEHRCSHCNATLTKRSILEEHITKKHPQFISSVSKQVYECAKCTFKTTLKSKIIRHMSVHSDSKLSKLRKLTCVHCVATFRDKKELDDHVLKKHPDFNTSITSDIFQCTECMVFKTTQMFRLKRHMAVHKDKITCSHCDATFRERSRMDEHILKNHPEFITSITRKIYKCTDCTYKTTTKSSFVSHMSEHLGTSSSGKRTCVHCNTTLSQKMSLDEHILRMHPEFIKSLTKSIYQCTECIYKTTAKFRLKRHMLVHKRDNTCIHCYEPFRQRAALDKHILKNHPVLITPVTSKLDECAESTYKASIKKSHIKAIHVTGRISSQALYRKVDNDLFTCDCCSYSTYSQRQLIRHFKEHRHKKTVLVSKPDINVHKCTVCRVVFKSKKALVGHGTKHRVSICIHCDAKFKNNNTRDDHVAIKHKNINTITIESACSNRNKTNFDRQVSTHSEPASSNKHVCIHCDATFKSKQTLDDHVVKKHPNLTKKIYECSECEFRTILRRDFSRHMSTHRESVPSNKYLPCAHCNAAFNRRLHLDDHVVKKHPNFINSVTRKIFECKECTFKTVVENVFLRHLSKHSVSTSKITCTHCKELLKNERAMNDHVVTNHPEPMKSINNKVYECDKCYYKTISKFRLNRHMSVTFTKKTMLNKHTLEKHPEFSTSSSKKTYNCAKCVYKTTSKSRLVRHMSVHSASKLTRKDRSALDEHIVKKHPNYVTTITSKIYECTECNYMTTADGKFFSHMLLHSETSSSFNHATCTHCDSTFADRVTLDEHVLERHPELTASITRKLYKCIKCNYTTTIRTSFQSHMSLHTEKRSVVHISDDYNSTEESASDDHVLELEDHREINTSTKKLYRCNQCEFVTVLKHRYFKHLPIHIHDNTPNAEGLYRCTECTFTSSTKDSFVRHMLVHFETRSCSDCNATFKSKRALDDHLIKKHPNSDTTITSKIFECTKCDHKTTRKSNILLHISRRHNDVDIDCIHCNAKFKRKQDLDVHLLEKHPNSMESITHKIYECTKCSYKTTAKGKFCKHRSLHTDGSIVCIHCNSRFKYKFTLDNHVLKRHPDFIDSITYKIFECENCDYKSVFRNSFLKHKTIHHNEGVTSIHCNASSQETAVLNDHDYEKNPMNKI